MNDLLFSGALAFLIPAAAWKKGALKPSAALLSGVMVFLTGLAGIACTLLMVISFLAVSVVEKLMEPRSQAIERENVLKSGPRDMVQVLVNGGFGLLALLLFVFTRADCFLVLYAASIAEALADSTASSVGMALQGSTFDICSFRRLSPGISGGISFGGTMAALAACAGVGLFAALTPVSDGRGGVIVTLSAFLGVLADSVLGSRFQRKNRCAVCGKITEKAIHCGQETHWHSGLRHLDNDGVNASSNLIACLLALLFCAI